MKIGYARISTNTQDLKLQERELQIYGCQQIFSESISGKDNNRPELNKMITNLRAGDIVVIYKIDRIARSLKGLIDLVEIFINKKVDLISLDCNDKLDTTSPMGKAFFQIAGVFAELERSMINARTKAGIEKAKTEGTKLGRNFGSRDKSTASKLNKINIFLNAGKTYDWIAQELKISKSIISSVKKNNY